MRSGRGVRSATVTVGREAENDILARALDDARAGRLPARCWLGRAASARAVSCTRPPRRPGAPAWVSRPAGPRSRRRRRSAWSPRRCGPGSAVTRIPRCGPPFDRGLRLILPEMGGPVRRRGRPGRRAAAPAGHGSHGPPAAGYRGPGPGMVLLLDDLHAADPDSLETIRYLAAARIDGLAIMAALRPAESAVADELVRALRGDDVATVVELEPLGHRATGDLVGASPRRGASRRARRRCPGPDRRRAAARRGSRRRAPARRVGRDRRRARPLARRPARAAAIGARHGRGPARAAPPPWAGTCCSPSR